MMGIIKYILPIGTFAIGIKLALDDDEYFTSNDLINGNNIYANIEKYYNLSKTIL